MVTSTENFGKKIIVLSTEAFLGDFLVTVVEHTARLMRAGKEERARKSKRLVVKSFLACWYGFVHS